MAAVAFIRMKYAQSQYFQNTCGFESLTEEKEKKRKEKKIWWVGIYDISYIPTPCGIVEGEISSSSNAFECDVYFEFSHSPITVRKSTNIIKESMLKFP